MLRGTWMGVACRVCLACAGAGRAAELSATVGPRGEVADVRVGGVSYLADLAVSLIKPGWAGAVCDQRGLDPAAVKVERQGAATVYTAVLSGEGGRAALREVVTTAPDAVTVEYEITPEQDIQVETVLVQGLLPAAGHAGQTRYWVADDGVVGGTCPAESNPDSHVVVGARPAEWVAFAAAAGGLALRIVPRALVAQFQDNRKWQVPAFGLLLMADGGRLAAGTPIRFAFTLAGDTVTKVEADARERLRGELAGLEMRDNRPLAIGRVTVAEAAAVAVGGLAEFAVELAATYDNPFDPEQVAVEAEVTPPGGTAVTVPGFYYVPMRVETKLGSERLRLDGVPGFRLRYTPTVAGAHRVRVTASDRSGRVTAAPVELAVTAAAAEFAGFVRVSRESPRYFADDRGRPFVPVGENVCWANGRAPLAEYGAWFAGLGAAGGNWARLWLAYNEKGLEWMPAPTPKPGHGGYLGLGRYAMDNAWRLDEIVRLAARSGVHVMFCLGTYGEFTAGGYFNEGCWVSNPYNVANGGPCAKPEDFWTDARARQLYQQRLRYLVARWGYAPDLFAWEFWNEVPPTPAIEAWTAEMAACLKRHDPNRHLVSTTYGSAAVWQCPDIDFTMAHMYGQAGNTADFTSRIVSQVRELADFGKPFLLAEFGIDWQTSDTRWDPKGSGLNMHNGAWASLLSGAAGTAMLWYWDGYVHPLNTYRILTPVTRFADQVDWTRRRFAPLTGLTVRVPDGEPETFADLTVPATVEWGRPAAAEYTVGRDGNVVGAPVAMTIGSPGRGKPEELYSRLTWHLDLPQATTLVLRLGQVCSRAHLRVAVDGEVRLDRDLTAGAAGEGPWKAARYLEQWKVWVSDYDEDIPLAVPAGRHDLTLENTDGDWLQVRSLALPAYRSSRFPDVNALGLQADDLVLLWLHNRESTWRTEFDGKQPRELKALQVSVPVTGDGAWTVQWWDTFKGEVVRRDTVTAAAGRLALIAPDLLRDVAARLDRQR